MDTTHIGLISGSFPAARQLIWSVYCRVCASLVQLAMTPPKKGELPADWTVVMSR